MTPALITDALQARLARYKQPSVVRIVDELPRTSMNKPDRARAKALLSEV